MFHSLIMRLKIGHLFEVYDCLNRMYKVYSVVCELSPCLIVEIDYFVTLYFICNRIWTHRVCKDIGDIVMRIFSSIKGSNKIYTGKKIMGKFPQLFFVKMGKLFSDFDKKNTHFDFFRENTDFSQKNFPWFFLYKR